MSQKEQIKIVTVESAGVVEPRRQTHMRKHGSRSPKVRYMKTSTRGTARRTMRNETTANQ